MTPEPAKSADGIHPLAANPEMLGSLIELMQATIQKVLHFAADSRAIEMRDGRLTTKDTSKRERILASGVSVEDVLQDAFVSLLQKDPATVVSWKALAQRIAHARAVDAVRKATKGRKTDARASEDGLDAINLSSLDELDLDSTFGSSTDITEDEYLRTEQQLVMRRVARECLQPRDLKVFFEIHFCGTARAPLAKEFGVTEVRISQIYLAAVRAVRSASRDDPAFSERDENEEEGDS